MKHLKTYEENNFNINDYLVDDGKSLLLSGLDLIELPEIPDTIEYLFCRNNNLTELPELPKGLTNLYCHNNKLTELPILPNKLEFLECGNNNLTELPDLPESLRYLGCYNNNLPYNDLDSYWEWFSKEYPDLWAAKQMGLY